MAKYKHEISDSERAMCRSLLKEAVEQASLAYQFSPGSYTYHALVAVRHAYTELSIADNPTPAKESLMR